MIVSIAPTLVKPLYNHLVVRWRNQKSPADLPPGLFGFICMLGLQSDKRGGFLEPIPAHKDDRYQHRYRDNDANDCQITHRIAFQRKRDIHSKKASNDGGQA